MIDRREKRDESEKDTKGMRGVSVTGLRGKKDAKDKKGRKEGRGKSERIGVKGRMRGKNTFRVQEPWGKSQNNTDSNREYFTKTHRPELKGCHHNLHCSKNLMHTWII